MSPVRRAVGTLPAAFALLAEGAWIAVVYDLLRSASGESTILGTVAFALAASAGYVAADIGPPRLRDRWPAAAVGFVGLVAILGWAAGPATRLALASGDLLSALTTHPGGWLLGLAALRGIAVAHHRGEDAPTGSLLLVGIPAIVVAHLLGGALAEPGRTAFREAALPDTIVFIGSGLAGLALARVRGLDDAAGSDWRRDRAWLPLMLALVTVILAVAVPASFAVGPVVMLAVGFLPLPLLFAGLLSGFDRALARATVITLGVLAVVVLIIAMLTRAAPRTGEGSQAATGAETVTPDQPWMAVAGWLLLVAALAVLVAVLAVIWMRRTRGSGGEDVAEERAIDRTAGGERLLPRLRVRRPRRVAAPRDAVEAYLAALVEVSGVAALARDPGETPAEHARRVTASLPSAPQPETGEAARLPRALRRLAIDYELVRFAGRGLTPAEDRRAIDRWATVRAAARSLHRR